MQNKSVEGKVSHKVFGVGKTFFFGIAFKYRQRLIL